MRTWTVVDHDNILTEKIYSKWRSIIMETIKKFLVEDVSSIQIKSK